MRYILIFLFAAMLSACVTPVKEADRELEKIIKIKNTQKDVIYERTKMWITENFVSAKSVIEYDNKEAGRIIGKGKMNYPCSGFDCMTKSNWKVKFTMKVSIKDNKLRLIFTNMGLSWPYSYNSGIPIQAYDGPVNGQTDMNNIKRRLTELSNELVSYINNPKNNENW